MPDLWSLPGPAQFAEDAAADVQEGATSVLALPEGAGAGLRAAVAALLGDAWNVVPVAAAGTRPPADALFARLPGSAAAPLRTARTLAEAPGAAGTVLWAEGAGAAAAPEWAYLAAEYAHAAAAQPVAQRPRVVVAFAGVPGSALPRPDAGLSVRRWSRVIAPLDMHLFCAFLFHNRAGPETELMALLAARLAGWDPALAERLRRFPAADLLRPGEALRAYALARGWSEADVPAWERGQCETPEAGVEVHAALRALRGEAREIEALIWSAQVAVLLPMLEQRRRELVTALGPMLQIPVATPFGVVRDRRDLEIGHIAHQAREMPVAPRLRSTVDRLVRIRNALAHFEPAAEADVLAPDVYRRVGN